MTRKGGDFLIPSSPSQKPHPSAFMLPLSGAGDETPSLASSALMRAFSASFSSRASRAISLAASNSSRLTMSRSRRIFSAWLRTTVSTSRLTPWAAPAASFIRRPISSKNRLLVWVISKHSPLSWPTARRTHGTQETMAILAPRFKPAMLELSLSCSYFLAIVLNGLPKKQSHDRQETPVIEQQVEIETKDCKTTTFITHP